MSLAIAVAVDPLAARLGKAGWALAIGAIALFGVAAVGSGLGPSGYPEEDLRPLVADLSERRQPDDRILVYEASRWAYALYAPTGMIPFEDPEEPIGFDILIQDSAVTVLGFHRFDPEGYAPEVAAGVGDADRVWLIVSHYRDDAAAIDRELIANGYTLEERHDRPGAYLARWTR